ncbi:MAG: helix-turn-helix domain-containing protein [Terriglobales bacterium]
MATTLAPVDSREVVRCDHCQIVQFRTVSGLCRRCRTPLDREEPPVIEAPPPPTPEPTVTGPAVQVAAAIRLLRQKNGLSQRQLAMRMRVPRTYVSKIENEKATPTLSSLGRLASALEVTVPELLNGGKPDPLSDLVADNFIAELVPYLAHLTPMQWQSVLAQVRDMTLHTRRSA